MKGPLLCDSIKQNQIGDKEREQVTFLTLGQFGALKKQCG